MQAENALCISACLKPTFKFNAPICGEHLNKSKNNQNKTKKKTVDKRSYLLQGDKAAHRFPFRLELLCVSRQLSDDLRHEVLRDNLMLARVVI